MLESEAVLTSARSLLTMCLGGIAGALARQRPQLLAGEICLFAGGLMAAGFVFGATIARFGRTDHAQTTSADLVLTLRDRGDQSANTKTPLT